jgi:hypothetical protein
LVIPVIGVKSSHDMVLILMVMSCEKAERAKVAAIAVAPGVLKIVDLILRICVRFCRRAGMLSGQRETPPTECTAIWF